MTTPYCIASTISFPAQAFVVCARAHALELNFGPGKTEAVVSLRGQGAKALQLEIVAGGGIQAGDVTVRVVAALQTPRDPGYPYCVSHSRCS